METLWSGASRHDVVYRAAGLKGGDDDAIPTLRVSWKAKKMDASNGGYNQEILEDIFSKVLIT